MIPPRPIVLHLSKPDYSGTLCGLGRVAIGASLMTSEALVDVCKRPWYEPCDECRRQAANTKEERE